MVVYIVGAGPGDPELITLKAMRLIKKAEVLIYDKLVNEDVLRSLRPECKRIFVGKRLAGAKGSQAMQRRINRLLVEHGRKSLVVRLKGGDPFVFGRGGEEAEVLSEAGIPFEIVPGIPSPVAVPAYAGIPITHRDHNSAVAILTGHEMDRDASRLDWSRMPDTLVILMGASNMPIIARRLIEAGRSPSTPVAAIRDGTHPQQVVRMTDLGRARRQRFGSPSIFVVGTVACLAKKLEWFGSKMSLLRGRTVALTRTEGHVDESVKLLRSFGAIVHNVPLIALRKRPFSLPPVKDFDAVVFTSVEGVKAVCSKVNIRKWKGKQFFAIGPATQALLAEHGIRSELPDEFNSQGLGEFMLGRLRFGSRVLLLRSSAASDVLRSILERSHDVLEVALYGVDQLEPDVSALKNADIIMLASASCARAFASVADKLKGRLVVSIGPMTSEPLIAKGIDHIEADEHTMEGMVKATLEHLWARTNTKKR